MFWCCFHLNDTIHPWLASHRHTQIYIYIYSVQIEGTSIAKEEKDNHQGGHLKCRLALFLTTPSWWEAMPPWLWVGPKWLAHVLEKVCGPIVATFSNFKDTFDKVLNRFGICIIWLAIVNYEGRRSIENVVSCCVEHCVHLV